MIDDERGALTRRALPGDAAWEEALRPRTLDEMVGQDRVRENLAVFIARRARSAASRSTTCCCTARPASARPRSAGIVAHEMGAALRSTSGPAIERPGDLAALLSNLEPGDVLFIDEIHRLPPVVEEILYPGDGGLPARHPDRAGAGRALDAPRPAALHPDRRHHARGPADLAAARSLRLGRAARVLPAAGPRAHPAALGAGAAGRDRGAGARRDRAARARHAARRQPAAAPRARLRGGRGGASGRRSRASAPASRSSGWTSTPRASTGSTARCSAPCSTSSRAGRSASRRWPPRSARTRGRSRTWSSPT